MRALAVSRLSRAAIKRPKKADQGARPKEAVLDILSPFAVQRIAALFSKK
jgi:hypothetical protein